MRAFNRLLALVLGLVMLAGGLLILIEAVLTAAGRPPWLVAFDTWYPTLTGTRFSSRIVFWAAIGVGVVGLLLLTAQVRPWAPRQLAVRRADGSADASWWVHRRSVEREVVGAVREVAGVVTAKTRLRGRRTRWRLRVSAQARPDLRPVVERAVRAQLERIAAPEKATLRITMRRPRRVS